MDNEKFMGIDDTILSIPIYTEEMLNKDNNK